MHVCVFVCILGTGSLYALVHKRPLFSLVSVTCTPPCVNGACVDGNVCACSAGYDGDRCDQPGAAQYKYTQCTHTTHTHTHTRIHAHTHAHMHIRTHTHAHTHTRAPTHARMHARTHTHIHVHYTVTPSHAMFISCVRINMLLTSSGQMQ